MRRVLQSVVPLTLFLCVLSSSSGCVALLAGGAAGAAGVAYANGAEKRVYARPVMEIADAVPVALARLGMTTSKKQSDALGAEIAARTATGKRVGINIKPVADGSLVHIRVGAVGDKDRARQIFDGLERELAQSPAIADPSQIPLDQSTPTKDK